ncbi:MAG: tetratricopeptide repeat protein [Opitutales bacterium]
MICFGPRWRVVLTLVGFFTAVVLGMAEDSSSDGVEAGSEAAESAVGASAESEADGGSEDPAEEPSPEAAPVEEQTEGQTEEQTQTSGEDRESSAEAEGQAEAPAAPALTAEDLLDGPLARTAKLSQLSPLEKARYYAKGESYNLAEKAYLGLVQDGEEGYIVQSALLELSEVYYAQGEYMKAVDTLDRSLTVFPNLAGDAKNIYRLGEFYRAAGLHEKAVSIFYRVINMIIMRGSEQMEVYFPVARMAQFQIARANYESGNFDEAYAAFDRIEVLELSRENREVVLYYKILSAMKAGEAEAGEAMVEDFSREFPESDYLPELVYLRAEVLMALGRSEEATDQLVQILETFEAKTFSDSGELRFWKQQAGNRLANRYYAEGDYAVALRIYQGLVGLSEDPAWQLPVIYQMGLCFEKLGRYERAQESYTYVLEDLAQIDAEQLSRALRQLGESATWRAQVLEWRQSAESDASALLNQGEDST